MDGKKYQLKPSIRDNSFIRRFKAGGTDRENYGEVISSKIARSILITNDFDFEAAPEIMLVYDDIRKRTPIASKYLEGEKVRNLDDFIQEKGNIKLTDKKHIRFIDGRRKAEVTNLKESEYDISGVKNKDLRQDISNGIAVSIIIGDHDINPGNFVVVTQGGKDRVARIDFGHAFNDLLNAPKFFGGKVRNKDNLVLDFFNREKIAGLTQSNSQSKLWRDYPGMIITQEMVDALNTVSQSNGVQKGIENAQKEYEALLKLIQEKGDKDGITHLKKSFNAINLNITGLNLDPKLSPESTIKDTLSNIKTFSEQNQKQMKDVAKLMQMQVNIDEIIESKKKGEQPSEEIIRNIKDLYKELRKSPGIGQKNGDLEWIKTSPEKAAHKGSLESYIKQRGKELGLDKQNSQELVHTDCGISKLSVFKRIFIDFIHAFNNLLNAPKFFGSKVSNKDNNDSILQSSKHNQSTAGDTAHTVSNIRNLKAHTTNRASARNIGSVHSR